MPPPPGLSLAEPFAATLARGGAGARAAAKKESPLSARGFIVTALMSGAVGAAVVFGVLARPAPPPEHAELVAAATAPRMPAEAPREIDDGTWTEDDIRHCRQLARAAADAAAQRRHNAVSAKREGLGGPSTEIVERSAHLLCSASRKPTHLCRDYLRKQFVAALKDYAAAFHEVSAQTYWTNYEVTQRAQRAAGNTDWQALTDDLRQTTHEMAKTHDAIVSAFRGLIADGIVDRGAFGVFLGLGIPPDIAAMMGEARPLRQVCP